jgi:hypothetical protein
MDDFPKGLPNPEQQGCLYGCYKIGVNPLPDLRKKLAAGYDLRFHRDRDFDGAVWTANVGVGWISMIRLD